jgi:cellulose synthase/poly-beta-1,6-N-acetylglucosamine synthase-like glycosyltransferase
MNLALLWQAVVTLSNTAVTLLVLTVAAIWIYQAVRAVWGLHAPAPLVDREDAFFGVLIAAHNKAGTMGAFFASLRALNYPRERLSILFVADHCTDATAAQIRAAGFECIERNSGKRGKTPSLAEGITRLREEQSEQLDAVAFFDADNLIDPDFFRQAAAGLAAGHVALQGHVSVHNWDVSWFSRLNHLNAVVENRLEELARSQLGWSCHLRGYGMVMSRALLEQLPWQDGSLVDDREILVHLVCRGHRVHWLKHACVVRVLSATARDAATQQRHWAGGHSSIVGHSVYALWRHWRASGQPAALHLMIDFLLPSHAVQLSLMFLAILLTAIVQGVFHWTFWLSLSLLPAYLAYFFVGNWLSSTPSRPL